MPLPNDQREAVARSHRSGGRLGGRSLEELASRVSGEAGDIITATAAIARDPQLAAAIRSGIIDRGLGAERSVWEAITAIGAVYQAGGDRLAARVVDLTSVRDRLIAQLSGRPVPGIPRSSAPYVLVAIDLAPTDAAVLDPAHCLAIATEQGGPTSHTAILARSLGIPAVVGAAGVTDIPEGTMVLVDGTSGEIVVDPGAQQLAGIPAPARAGRCSRREPLQTVTGCRCWPTSARRRRWPPLWQRARKGSDCSAPSSVSSAVPRRPALPNRPQRTVRCSPRSRGRRW